MALTNTQYDTIIREYNKKQLQNRRDQEARIALAEKELPELSQINGEIASLSMKCARRLLEGEAASIDDLKTEIAAYGIHRKALLKNAGFPEDFLDVLAGISAGHAVFHRFWIIMEAEMVKIFRFQD